MIDSLLRSRLNDPPAVRTIRRREKKAGPLAAASSLCLFFAALTAARCTAAEPSLRDLNLHGLQAGAVTTLIVDGDELGTAPRLLLPFPARAELKPGSTDKRATYDIAVEGNVPAGYYQARVYTEGGVSASAVIGVDRLPQRAWTPAIEQLPAALHGSAGGSTIAETKFSGKAGDQVSIEVEAQRLGSKLRPILHLYNASRLQIAWAWGTPALFGDARLQATLPADGEYIIAVHDSEYGPPGPAFFRLKVGKWAYVDQVFPPVVGPAQVQTIEFMGTSPTPRVNFAASSAAGAVRLPWPAEALWSGARPFVTVSAHAEVLEQTAPAGLQELPAGRVGVSGRLLLPYEEDRYKVAVVPGSKLRLEAFAARSGSPVDVALVVRNEAGAALARVEDGAGTVDPVLEYTVPDKTTSVIVGVVDALGRGGPHGVYRLAVDPQMPGSMPTEFDLSTPAQRLMMPAGGRTVVPVLIARQNYSGKVDLSADGLPAGYRLDGATIPEEAEGALVTVERKDTAGEAAITTWNGRGADGHERPVFLAGHPLRLLQPWLASELALGPTAAKAADFQIDWRNLPGDATLNPTGRLVLPIKITRPAGDALVRLTLLTSQPPRISNGVPDPNRALRAEKPVELAANVTEADFGVLVPMDLPSPVYDLTLEASLLSADKRLVLATAFAPVRRMEVRSPVVVQLSTPAQIEAALDAQQGATFKIAGKVERQNGFKGDVLVTLTGLPAGARADAVTIKPDADEFAANLIVHANLPAGEYRGLKVFASLAPDPNQPTLRIRSRGAEFALLVKPAAK
ncbi:MAG TPA: hypothetical protein VKU82_03995 [Planctomycetaceae bacterium]|nr:hypothetical protein [Planctomycetaceae bacterium]